MIESKLLVPLSAMPRERLERYTKVLETRELLAILHARVPRI